jgi:endonuclease YncB( thermonuclease family)
MRLISTLAITMISIPAQAGQAIVIDGDTIELDGQNYRLHGIDAPEAGQKCSKAGGGNWRCGDIATESLIKLVRGKQVQCDNRGKDGFERVIGVCSVGGVDINRQMVLKGYAWAFRKFSQDYIQEENTARNAGLGIWQANTQTAESFRAERWVVAKQISPNGCPIKGNISRNGRIYHAPWSPWYNRTKISINKGERWFCSEAEALEAGWRAPYWGN